MSAGGALSNSKAIALYQNSPNPVGPMTSIAFKLPFTGHTKLGIYDLRGKLLDTVVDEELGPGIWSFDWARGTLGPGVYLYKLYTNGETITKEMLLK